MAAFDQGSLSVCHQVLRWSIRKETLTQNDSFVHPEELTDCNRQRHLTKSHLHVLLPILMKHHEDMQLTLY